VVWWGCSWAEENMAGGGMRPTSMMGIGGSGSCDRVRYGGLYDRGGGVDGGFKDAIDGCNNHDDAFYNLSSHAF